MCGIAGFLGQSKRPQVTYQLITKLFEKTEARGVDAAGFWGTQPGRNGKIIYHKEPIKSSVLVRKEIWRRTARLDLNMLLVHARQASQGVGEPADNRNNHPFVSSNRCIGLIHNGRISEPEYQALKQKYEVFSECDSEILLRVFEGAERYGRRATDEFPDMPVHVACRFCGLRDIFSHINHGHMAVAIGERNEDDRYLWLFRNAHRSLWIADLREKLGQVFFCSTAEIWQDAVAACHNLQGVIGRSHKLIEVLPEEIWYFRVSADSPNVERVQRYDVSRDSDVRPWVFDGERLCMNRQEPEHDIICKLDQNELVVRGEREPTGPCPTYDMHSVQTWCQRIREKVCDIETQAQVLSQEGSIMTGDFRQLMDCLEQHDLDLEGTLKMLQG